MGVLDGHLALALEASQRPGGRGEGRRALEAPWEEEL